MVEIMPQARVVWFGLLVGTSLWLPGCDNDNARFSREESAISTLDQSVEEAAPIALEELTFQDVGDTSTCTQDCSGNDAGFEWARGNDITDESECSGNSQSFIEGCEEYARQVQEREESEDEEEY